MRIFRIFLIRFVFLFLSHCENNTLSCEVCPSITTPTPTPAYAISTTLPYSTLVPEGTCERAMDLAFLLDGSAALSEGEFQATKDFILSVVEKFRMGSAHTRATVLLYHSGVKTYDLQVDKNIRVILHTVKSCLKMQQCIKNSVG